MLGLAPDAVDLRTHPRIEETAGLCAAVRPVNRTGAFAGVRDICAGGMGISPCPELHPDEVVRFEFWGPGFAWSGTARVAHAEPHSAGLQFLRWDGPVHRPLNRLLSKRS